MASVVERVDRLEAVLQEFITSTDIQFKKLYDSQMRTEAELRAFKDEVRDDTRNFKDEMRVFKDGMEDFKNEMRVFKDGVEDFKGEMREFKEEGRRYNREMNRRWGEMSKKLGTMVEDLVAPSLPRIVQEIFQRRVLDLSVRRKREFPDGRGREFDVIAVTEDLICLNSTKSTLRRTDVDGFEEEIDAFRTFFPEYQDKPVVGALASLAVDESVLNYAQKMGFLVLAVGDQIMEVKNRPGFEPKLW